MGHANVLAYFRRLGPTFPNPSQVVLVGGSMGGMGALFNFRGRRGAGANAAAYLLDDSGPLLAAAATAITP